jgi:hypothetical protein
VTERDTTEIQPLPAPAGATAAPDPASPAGATPEAPAAESADGGPPATAPALPATPPTRPAGGRRPAGPLTRMGPWAPVAGALLGVVLGVVAVLLLAGQADDFRDRLSLVFLVVGLGLLGASGTLLADEVRMLRWRAREAALRPAAWTDTTASLVNGLTPARLLLVVSGFVLFLAAYVARS